MKVVYTLLRCGCVVDLKHGTVMLCTKHLVSMRKKAQSVRRFLS